MSARAQAMQGNSLSALGRFLVLVAVVDIVLVVASAFFAMGLSNRLTSQLNLGHENNAAVWWSSATLLLAALLFFDSAFRHAAHKNALLALSLLLVFLSLDEQGSLHERIFTGNYWSYVPYGLVGGLLFLYAFFSLYKDKALRSTALLIFVGFSCFGSVVVQEFFEHNVNWPEWALGLRVAVEEGSELLGTALCLLAAGRLLGMDQSSSLPVPARVRESRSITLVVCSVAIVAGIIAAIKAPGLSGYPTRGNPALWFAMAAFLCLVYEVLRGHRILSGLRHHLVLVVLGVSASLAQAVFVYTRMELWMLVAVDVVLFIIIAVAMERRRVGLGWALCAITGLVVLAFIGAQGSATATFLLSFACACSLIALKKTTRLPAA